MTALALVGGTNFALAQNVGNIITYNGGEYKVTGENLVINGSFDDGVNNWYAGDGTNNTSQVAANASNFTIQATGGFDDGPYLQYSAGGAKTATTIKNHFTVEQGKMYLFRCYTSGKTPDSNNLQYSKIWASADGSAETTALYQLQWGASAGQTSSTWKQNDFIFTATTNYIVFRSSWTSGAKLDGFFLGEVKLNDIAGTSDYDALNTAVSTVENKAWGFDANEFAPYNHVEVLEALAQAKAIDQANENPKSVVTNLTATLNGATWTANTGEVNAIWDPSFQHDYSGLSGNVQPIGWFRVKGTTGDGYNVRYMGGTNAGLAATSSGKALFTKFQGYYGWQDGYTMPLNENTYYTIGFIYGGWGDCKKDGYVQMEDPDGIVIDPFPSKNLPLDEVAADSKTESWKTYSGIFKTKAAGNYVLALLKTGASQQSQYVYGDFMLKQTTTAEAIAFYNTVHSDVESSYDADANGGEEKNVFKAALDANMEGKTPSEIMEAANNLYTLRDAFVAATQHYNNYVAEKANAERINASITTGINEPTTVEEAVGALHTILVNEYNYVKDNFNADAAEAYGITIDQWTGTATSGGNTDTPQTNSKAVL